MKIRDIIDANRIISGVDLCKLDKETRMAMYENCMAFSRIIRQAAEDEKVLKDKILAGTEKESARVSEIRDELQYAGTMDRERVKELKDELESYQSFLDREKEFFEADQKLMEKEIDIEVKKMKADSFLDGMSKAGLKITAGEMFLLNFLFE